MNELALTESPSLRAQYADRVEGHVYILEISSGRVKVGFTTSLKTRLANHASTAKAYGATITRTWTSPFHAEAGANEKALIRFCTSMQGEAGDGEYFAGVLFNDVVAFAEAELTITEIARSASTAELRKVEARQARARRVDATEDRTEFVRRRVHAELRAAGVEPNGVPVAVWLGNPEVVRLLARLYDAEQVGHGEIRDVFAAALGGAS